MPPPVEVAPPPGPPPPPVVVVTPEAAPPPVVAAAAAPAKTWKDFLTLDGNTDAYFMWNFAHDGSTLNGPQARAFDVAANSFSLNYAKLGIGLAVENVAFRADLGYGHTGAIINATSAGSSPSGPASFLYGSAFIAQQAFASVTWGQLTVDFGKFVTTAGAEVIEANKNWLYSRSLLFNSIPFLHTGARANFKASDQITVEASIVNGWNNDPDITGDKTFEIAIKATPTPMLGIFATTYFGKEGISYLDATTPSTDTRFLGDLVAALTVNDMLGVNLNIDYIKEGDFHLFGLAAMGRYVAAPHAVLSLRAELVNNNNGGGGAPATNVYEGTLGLASPWAGHYELRAELRADFADQTIFVTGPVAMGGEAKKNQVTGTIAALAYF